MVVSGILLGLSFFRGQNAVWGRATTGLVVGIIVGLVMGNFLNGLMWGFAVGTLIGFGADLLGMLGDKLRRYVE